MKHDPEEIFIRAKIAKIATKMEIGMPDLEEMIKWY